MPRRCARASSPAPSTATVRARSTAVTSRPRRSVADSTAGHVALRDHAPRDDVGGLRLIARRIGLLHREQCAGVLPVLAARGEYILSDARIALRRDRGEAVAVREISSDGLRRRAVLGPGRTDTAEQDEDDGEAGEAFHAAVFSLRLPQCYSQKRPD